MRHIEIAFRYELEADEKESAQLATLVKQSRADMVSKFLKSKKPKNWGVQVSIIPDNDNGDLPFMYEIRGVANEPS